MLPISSWIPLNWRWFWIFVTLFLFRYVRLWVNLAANWLYTPISPPDEPTITSRDVTVILPTVAKKMEDIQQLKETLQTAISFEPFQILIVTPEPQMAGVNQMLKEMAYTKKVRVMSVSKANKRLQLSQAIPEVETKITLLLDDDVWLPEKFSKWVLAPFEDPKVGGVGTNQSLRRNDRWNPWEFLGAIYLLRRNFDCTACNRIDGSLPCLSGRAVAYRSEILKDEKFRKGLMHEKWGTTCLNMADDDNFITRWLFNHDWKIQIQNHRECEVETTLENNHKYLNQCLRWVRSNWRSNLTSLGETRMWTKYPWSLYAVFQTTVTQWAFPYDVLLATCFYLTLCQEGYYDETRGEAPWQRSLLWSLFLGHYAFSKTIKLIPHLLRNPGDILFVPVSVLFGYFHNLIKLFGYFTVTETSWGTREGVDTDNNIRMIPVLSKAQITPPSTPPPQGHTLRERNAMMPMAVS